MRTLGFVAALGALLVSPAAAASRKSALTLTGPTATTYGHRVDLAGRLSPARPGATVRLFRGTSLVTTGRVRRNGAFRLQLRVARPGPFRARVGGVWSKPLTIRIHPFLDTSLVGERVAGGKLSLRARLRPAYAGSIRVHVLRPGRREFTGMFGATARVAIGTAALEPFRVAVETVPRPGFERVERDLPVSLRPPAISYGATGPAVQALAERLRALRYAVPYDTSSFGSDLLESVYAFEKAQGLPRTGEVDAAFWSRLDHPALPTPRYRTPDAHIEVDKTRQILLVVRDGHVALISPVSTAGIPGYYTPEGRFAIFRKVPGYDPSPLGILYKPMYFYNGYAIHGNPSVPPYPASHGCIRVPNFVIERLYSSEPYGETVYVY